MSRKRDRIWTSAAFALVAFMSALSLLTGCEGTDTDHTDVMLGGLLAGAVLYTQADSFMGTGQTDLTTSGNTRLPGSQTFAPSDWQIDQSSGGTDDGAGGNLVQSRPPDAPTNPVPADGGTGAGTSLELSWKCTDPDKGDILSYDIYLSTSENPGTRISNGQFDTYLKWFGLKGATKYFWKVVATDKKNNVTVGPVWSFATAGFVEPEKQVPPDKPSAPEPSNNSVDQEPQMVFKWTGGDKNTGETVKYELYLDTANPPTIKIAEGLTATEFSYSSMEKGTKYYWKIVATDSTGLSTEGDAWAFTTRFDSFALAPSNPNPPDASEVDGLQQQLQWTGGTTNDSSVTYRVYLGTTSSPGPQDIKGTVADPVFTVSGTTYETTYYWQVEAVDALGHGIRGPVWSFTTGANPDGGGAGDAGGGDTDALAIVPSNPIPAVNSKTAGQELTVYFDGGSNDGSEVNYQIFLGESVSKSSMKSVSNSITNFADLAEVLEFSKSYHWYVKATGTDGKSVEGPVWSLNTIDKGSTAGMSTPNFAIGSATPDFVYNVGQTQKKLSQTYGKLLVLNIFTTTCPYCAQQIDTLAELYNSRGSKTEFLSVCSTNSTSDFEILMYKLSHMANWDFASNPGKSITRYFKVEGVPQTIFIGKTGKVLDILIGAYPKEVISSLIEKYADQ